MILILSYIYEAGDVSPSAVAYGGSVLPSVTGTLERSCIAGTRRKSLPGTGGRSRGDAATRQRSLRPPRAEGGEDRHLPGAPRRSTARPTPRFRTSGCRNRERFCRLCPRSAVICPGPRPSVTAGTGNAHSGPPGKAKVKTDAGTDPRATRAPEPPGKLDNGTFKKTEDFTRNSESLKKNKRKF